MLNEGLVAKGFKVGDRVICVSSAGQISGDGRNIQFGEEAIVTAVSENGLWVSVFEGVSPVMTQEAFELLEAGA